MIKQVFWDVCTPDAACRTVADRCANLQKQLAALCGSADRLVFVRLFFSDIANQLAEVVASPLYTGWLDKAAVSWVEQPPLDGSRISLLVAYAAPGVAVERQGTSDRMRIRVADAPEVFFQRIRFSPAEASHLTVAQQTEEAFRRHAEWIAPMGLTLEADCQRTWIYVRDIDNNYADVVRARNRVFDSEGLTEHYIASTGIGGAFEVRDAYVGIDFLSVRRSDLSSVAYLQATDYLNPTREYGVAFERGTSLTFSDASSLHLISGTASIDRHGECLFRGDVQAQTERLFLNIAKLLEAGGARLSDMSWMTVYLRDVSDAPWVGAYLRRRFPQVPFVLTLARVCRPEWLIEIECFAQSAKQK